MTRASVPALRTEPLCSKYTSAILAAPAKMRMRSCKNQLINYDGASCSLWYTINRALLLLIKLWSFTSINRTTGTTYLGVL